MQETKTFTIVLRAPDWRGNWPDEICIKRVDAETPSQAVVEAKARAFKEWEADNPDWHNSDRDYVSASDWDVLLVFAGTPVLISFGEPY